MSTLDDWRKKFPDKFAPEQTAFQCIHRGDTIFIGSACAEPQYLVQGLIRYVQSNPKAFFDAEVLGIRTLGVAPYATEKFKDNFRHNSFFIGDNTREAVNTGVADYTPVFLSEVPGPLLPRPRSDRCCPDPDFGAGPSRLYEPGGKRGYCEGRSRNGRQRHCTGQRENAPRPW